jgi:hypothetical protein
MNSTKEKEAEALVLDCISQAEKTDLKLDWQVVQEFLRKKHLIYRDNWQKRVMNLSDGTMITMPDGSTKEITNSSNTPIDPHITTIDIGITAKVESSFPFLTPQVRAATGEDEDEDAAVNSTHLLIYYHKGEEKLYKQAMGWLKPTGNAYGKDYWDKNAGNFVFHPTTLAPLTDDNGKQLKLGDITSKINSPQKMLVPGGIPGDEDLPWIGEETAKPVKDIQNIWGVEVKEESNLEDIEQLKATGNIGQYQKQNILKGHARVYEIYFKPDSEHPYGRLIIYCSNKILYDGVWDQALTEKYPDFWHPYSHVGYKKIQGDYWYKSIFEYLIEHQMQLNRIYSQIMAATKRLKGAWISQENSNNLNEVSFDGEGFANIEYKIGALPPSFQQIMINVQQFIGLYNMIIQRMNDLSAQYETTRGNPDPSITSGKQAQIFQNANAMQSSPLLSNLADWYIERCIKKLRLCVTHFEDSGRLIQITGEENESIAFSFTPDQIKSEDIVIANGPWFFMDPMQRTQKADQLYAMGAFGNPQSPQAQKKLMFLQGIGGGLEDVYAEHTADIKMAKAENQMFKSGQLLETDQIVASKHPLMQQYQANLQAWQQAMSIRSGAVQALMTNQVSAENMKLNGPPPDPGPEPVKPTIYRMARDYEDHQLHVEILNQLRKSTRFEKMCLQNPELRVATDFHFESHKSYLIPPPMQLPPGMGGQNIPGSNPPAGAAPPGAGGVQ